MISYYRSENGKLFTVDGVAPNTWVRMTQPTQEEIALVSGMLGDDVSEVNAFLDRDEGSRWESDGGYTTIVIDIPYKRDGRGPPYDTLPFAIVISGNILATICQIESPVIRRIVETKKMDIEDKISFVLKILYAVSQEYQVLLREINTRRKEIELNINVSIKNDDIIELHNLESSLVYFSTSLRACNVVLDKMKRYTEKVMDAQHLDMLHDVIIENEQAVEMASTYQFIIDGTRELFSSVMNNKLNATVRWLTAVTIILSVPAIIGALWGMNVQPLPFDKSPLAFWILSILIIIICAVFMVLLRRKNMI